MLSVLIVSENRLYREGLAEMLGREGSLRVAGTAARVDEALQRACELVPAVVILDQAIPACLSLARSLTMARPEIRIVALGVADREELVLSFGEAGIAGYLPLDGSVEELVSVVQQAARGELQCTPRIAGALLRRLAWRAAAGEGISSTPLTAREAEIVRLIDHGLSNKEIAVRLGIEVATVKNHVHNLLEKLRVHRRAEAAARLRGRDPRFTPPFP